MFHPSIAPALAGAILSAMLAAAPAQASDHPSVKRAVNLPPSADLGYTIKARQRGFMLNGEAHINWRAGDGKYTIQTESRASMLGKILENRSEGTVDGFGIAPAQFYEKRFRKDPYTTTFNRATATIAFTESEETYPLKGGEQDRASVTWQLAALARAAPGKFTPGSEWSFFVAGRRDAQPWSFKVLKREKVATGVGELETVHLVRKPPADSREQQVEVWLAPALEWYPARVRVGDQQEEYIEQTLQSVTKK